MKKLMLLGGSRYIIPVIKTAQSMGIYVITCDYLPDNIAHQYSDQYINASVVEKEQILREARKLEIDGVMSFACDPGVLTAAYVAEQLGLPFQGSYESVKILQDKGLFRKFLADNNFNVPYAKRYTKLEDALCDSNDFRWPVIVKPVDSAGSKGVSRVDTVEVLTAAIRLALEKSICGAFVIEEFLTFKGYHSSADVFTVNGVVKFITYSDQMFDQKAENPYTPAFIVWPSTMDNQAQEYLTTEIQRLMSLLDMKTGIYNIETCVGIDGKPYIMEVSPRGGGCKIAELQHMAYGVNLIEKEIKQAVGIPVGEIEQKACVGEWCELVIHADSMQSGTLEEVIIRKDIKDNYVKVIDLATKKGDVVSSFSGADKALGDMFLKFNSRKELDRIMNTMNEWLSIQLE